VKAAVAGNAARETPLHPSLHTRLKCLCKQQCQGLFEVPILWRPDPFDGDRTSPHPAGHRVAACVGVPRCRRHGV